MEWVVLGLGRFSGPSCVRVRSGRAGAGGSVSRGRAVVPGGARSGRAGAGGSVSQGRAVVPGGARSYLRGVLRYDRVELRTTGSAGGTTAPDYVRPRGFTYDRAGPMTHGDEAAYAPRRPGLHRPTAHATRTSGAGLAGPAERSRTHADAGARTRKQRVTSTRDLRDSFVQGRARACCKEAAYRYRQRRRTRNINDSSCAFRPKPDPCSRIGHPSAGTDPRRQTVRRRPAPSKGTTTSDPTSGTTRDQDPSPLPRRGRQPAPRRPRREKP